MLGSLSLFLGSFAAGCGGDEPTVIEPGPDYQLTEQEKENLAAENASRGG